MFFFFPPFFKDLTAWFGVWLPTTFLSQNFLSFFFPLFSLPFIFLSLSLFYLSLLVLLVLIFQTANTKLHIVQGQTWYLVETREEEKGMETILPPKIK
jgi:hypothetical protein